METLTLTEARKRLNAVLSCAYCSRRKVTSCGSTYAVNCTFSWASCGKSSIMSARQFCVPVHVCECGL